MKIGMLLPANYAIGNPFNGVREQALSQASSLEYLGHEVIHLSPWEKYDLNSLDVLHYFFGGHWMHGIDTMPSSPETVRVFAPIIDTVESTSSYRWAARLGSLHSKFITLQAQYKRQSHNADVVVVRSRFEADKVINGLGVGSDKVRIVLNGCPAPSSNADPEAARAQWNLDEDFVLHVSRYTNKSKNVLNLINAVGPTGLPLIIAGTHETGPYHDAIMAAAASYPKVQIIGFVSEEMKNSLYAACKVFCLPSTREGTGLVAVEAASYGASIVVTAEGGPPDYFGEHACYTKDSTVHSISAAVTDAWKLDRNLNVLRDHVCSNLAWGNSARQLEMVYGEFMR